MCRSPLRCIAHVVLSYAVFCFAALFWSYVVLYYHVLCLLHCFVLVALRCVILYCVVLRCVLCSIVESLAHASGPMYATLTSSSGILRATLNMAPDADAKFQSTQTDKHTYIYDNNILSINHV